MYPDKESAVWVNNMIVAVISNHHKYISLILLRFLNPLLHQLMVIPPVVSHLLCGLEEALKETLEKSRVR